MTGVGGTEGEIVCDRRTREGLWHCLGTEEMSRMSVGRDEGRTF